MTSVLFLVWFNNARLLYVTPSIATYLSKMEVDGAPVWVSHHPHSIVRIRTRIGEAT